MDPLHCALRPYAGRQSWCDVPREKRIGVRHTFPEFHYGPAAFDRMCRVKNKTICVKNKFSEHVEAFCCLRA
jgi:hypothetical protein